MAITLTEMNIPARYGYIGQDADIDISAGQRLKIETTPGGEEVLNWECPAGESWSARIIVELQRD